jgi:hypothetical protein
VAHSLAFGLAGLELAACSGVSATAPIITKPVATFPSTPAAAQQATQAPNAPWFVCGESGVKVSTASQLKTALFDADPGETILLAPGTYLGNFGGSTSGTRSAPITLCGPRSAVMDGGSTTSGYAFHLDQASWWRIEGFTVEGGQKGVVTDTSDHVLIYGLYVHGVGDEAIHLRAFSSYDTVSHNVIRDTGLYNGYYGEGIYVGSANHNWCQDTNCRPDESDHDVIIGNNIADTTAENIDIKEGTSFGTIVGNRLNGAGMSSSDATSWVNVKGNDWTVIDNTGIDSNTNGFSDHQVYPGWGIDNVFESNVATVNGPGYGFFVQSGQLHDVISCNNKVTRAQSGYSNHACMPEPSLADRISTTEHR